jgi:hypothetical protein
MFFPCTHGDDIELYPNSKQGGTPGEGNDENNKKKYLDKPTIIMCNPNALVYQWMISSANAYWLDFFLRRECNVLTWNNRGYGQSQ